MSFVGEMQGTELKLSLLCWPDVPPVTLALIDEITRAAMRLQPSLYLQISVRAVCHERPPAWLPAIWLETPPAEASELLLLLADEPAETTPELLDWLRPQLRAAQQCGAIGGGVFALAASGLLDQRRAAVHWRWLDEFAERFPAVHASTRLFDQDEDCLTCCGGMALADLLLAWLAREQGSELAQAVADELMLDRLRDSSELQRLPLRNRLAASHPRLGQAVALMEANIGDPLTTDEIARQCCVSRRQLERIFKQCLNQVPSQYYQELRLNRARQMLQQSSTSIVQIGLSCGFSSGPHFSSAYRNFFGLTPREERNQARSSLAGRDSAH